MLVEVSKCIKIRRLIIIIITFSDCIWENSEAKRPMGVCFDAYVNAEGRWEGTGRKRQRAKNIIQLADETSQKFSQAV